MSLISKITKGLKKITLKKALPIIGGAAALAIPGVGGAVAAGIGAVASGASRTATAAGKVVTSVATGAVKVAQSASGSIVDTLGTVADARTAITDAEKKAAAAVGRFKGSAAGSTAAGAFQGFFDSIPPGAWLIIGGIVAAFFIARNSRGPRG